MKFKKAIVFICVCLLATSVFAQRINSTNSIGITGGVEGTISFYAKPYLTQDVLFVCEFENGIYLDAGVRFYENCIYRTSAEPYFYYAPIFDFGYKHWYIGGGALFYTYPNTAVEDTVVSFVARTGGTFGGWQWGKFTANMRVGIEVSPTIYLFETSEDADDATAAGNVIGSIFATVFNIPKLNIGLLVYLPVYEF